MLTIKKRALSRENKNNACNPQSCFLLTFIKAPYVVSYWVLPYVVLSEHALVIISCAG